MSVASPQRALTARPRRACAHLFQYLNMRPGVPLVAYEPAFQPVVDALLVYASELNLPLEVLDVTTVSVSDLDARLEAADKFLCAYNRTFGTGFAPYIDVMAQYTIDRAAHSYTITDMSKAFFGVFQECPTDIVALNAALIRILQAGRNLVVTDSHGSRLEAELRPEYDWVNMDGFSEADFDLTCNLPVGEVASYSTRVNATLRFAGSLLGTIPIGRKYGYVEDPIEIDIAGGKVTRLKCSSSALQRDLEFCLYWDAHTSTVNELGFGTNGSVLPPLLGFNYKYEENRKGFHLGFGASLAQQNVERLTPHHLDMLFADSQMELDGELLFDGTSYRLDAFPAATSGAPLRVAAASCCTT